MWIETDNKSSKKNFEKRVLLPAMDIMSATTNIPYLTVSDIDHNMPSEINFNYYSPTEFHNNNDISKHRSSKHSFSLLHCNVQSLSKNHDNFINMLSDINHTFQLLV